MIGLSRKKGDGEGVLGGSPYSRIVMGAGERERVKERCREDSLPSLPDPSELDGSGTGLGGRRANDEVLVNISRERMAESGKVFRWSTIV